jgi:hypothetical protein
MRCSVAGVIMAMVLTGCISRPKLDAERSRVCVSETFAFAELTRGVTNPVAVVLERQDKEFFEIGVFENAPGVYHRLGAFRVGRDRRIWRMDLETADWRLIGLCD